MSEVGFLRRQSKDSEHDGTKPAPDQSSTHGFDNLLVFRYTLFIVLEAAFTALAWYCFRRPRALPTYVAFDLRTVKSGFITIFNLWHTIAIACALSICAEAFSKEWAARDEKTDVVSTVSSGTVDRLYYFFTRRATKTFKAAFAIFLALVVMRTTGPSTITATDGVPSERDLPIGLISTTSLTPDSTAANSTTFLVRLAQANMVVRLEQLLGLPWGYVPQQNWVIPLPTQELNMTNRVAYETDLVFFNYSCQWTAPDSFNGNNFTIENATWSTTNPMTSTRGGGIRNGSTILQLRPATRASGTSAYLFLGGNSTFPVNSTHLGEAWIDLSGLPNAFNPTGFISSHNEVTNLRAPLASILICDPQLHFTSGTALLSPSSNITEPDVTVEESGSSPHIGNIDTTAARQLFASALSFAVNQPDSGPWLRIIDFLNFNSVVGQMLLNLPSFPLDWATAGALAPLDPAKLDDNVNKYTLSALKAFTSGYRGEANIQQVSGVFATEVRAEYTSTKLALATSIQFAILHTVMFAITTIGLAVLGWLNRTQGRIPFSLEVVALIYRR